MTPRDGLVDLPVASGPVRAVALPSRRTNRTAIASLVESVVTPLGTGSITLPSSMIAIAMGLSSW